VKDAHRVLERAVDAGVFPGAQAVVRRMGAPLLEVEVGRRGPGLEPVGAEVRYDLASLTKALGTALLWAHHYEQGRVDPADRLAASFSRADPRVEHHHVLRHVAGYPAHRRLDRVLPRSLEPGSPAARAWIARAAAETPLAHPPAARTVYSDLGFMALGAALEAVGGRSLERQLGALGCPLSGPRPASPARAVSAHEPRVAPTGRTPLGATHDDNAFAMGGVAGHAGQFGAARAVGAWAEAALAAFHGERDAPWAPETVRALWRPRPGSVWTWGWDRATPGGTTGGWPEDAVGHLGFTGTSLWIHPPSGLLAVLLTNRTAGGGSVAALRAVRRAFYAAVWAANREKSAVSGAVGRPVKS
jgi:CubicO group peptidase (beta-lactamase class C family)